MTKNTLTFDVKGLEDSILSMVSDTIRENMTNSFDMSNKTGTSSHDLEILDKYIEEKVYKILHEIFDGQLKKQFYSMTWYGRR